MNRIIFAILCISFSLSLVTSIASATDSLSHPESAVLHGGVLYVSNLGSKLTPSEKDGDGYISQLNTNGSIKVAQWISGLNAPKGMLLISGILYVADIDHVLGFDIHTKKKIFDLDLSHEKTVFLNDITSKNMNTLLVSSTDTGKIFEINLRKKSYITLTAIIPGANGLTYDRSSGRIYFVTFGTENKPNGYLGYIDSGMNIVELSSYRGYLDGINLDKKTHEILFSDWVAFEKKGVILSYNMKTATVIPLAGDLLGGPADFIRDSRKNIFYLPAMLEDRIIMIQK